MQKKWHSAVTTFLLILVCWLVYTGWLSWQTRRTLTAVQDVVQSEDLTRLLNDVEKGAEKGIVKNLNEQLAASDPSATENPAKMEDDSVGLALRGILLRQGENGMETWRLNAEWATLRQASGLLEVRAPDAIYALGDPAKKDYIYVQAEQGWISDNNTKLLLNGQVTAVRDDTTIVGDQVTFDNQNRILVYPAGAELDGAKLSGKAEVLRWDLNTDILHGDQGVSVILYDTGALPLASEESTL